MFWRLPELQHRFERKASVIYEVLLSTFLSSHFSSFSQEKVDDERSDKDETDESEEEEEEQDKKAVTKNGPMQNGHAVHNNNHSKTEWKQTSVRTKECEKDSYPSVGEQERWIKAREKYDTVTLAQHTNTHSRTPCFVFLQRSSRWYTLHSVAGFLLCRQRKCIIVSVMSVPSAGHPKFQTGKNTKNEVWRCREDTGESGVASTKAFLVLTTCLTTNGPFDVTLKCHFKAFCLKHVLLVAILPFVFTTERTNESDSWCECYERETMGH